VCWYKDNKHRNIRNPPLLDILLSSTSLHVHAYIPADILVCNVYKLKHDIYNMYAHD